MGLLSDHQIRALCQGERPMIDPFVEKMVRQGVMSYGLSSYGYDIRVSNQFKIFTPTPYNTVVDPKALDERSLMSFEGDVCIVPPNSFALAVTVEYFRIPRDILTITVGKSSYARCFRGDTRVALVDGTAPTLEEMANRALLGEKFWGYSIGTLGRIIVTLLDCPRFIGRDALMEIVLDNDESIFCTPDHEFITRNGQLMQAAELRVGQALMPLVLPTAANMRTVFELPYSNHKVKAMRDLPGDHDVYCLTVPEAGNFALEAGVFVRNCGIITNVTPLEPEWEGYVTLEISNTTPLPAKIYANEGIAQVLFFRAEEVCETSYGDRKGKYQGQTGITLPRV